MTTRKRTAVWIWESDAKKMKARAKEMGFVTLTSYLIHLFVNDAMRGGITSPPKALTPAARSALLARSRKR